ncbi:hypothetical protein VL15_03130 [Burkholderia cepacia]|uniref:HigA2-like helix-turn-helix domain-containing protein n=1 Tax=Burkholderia cepacia TaxID=292 RepID=A0A0J5XIH9_BURCE|nr:XRE family transcriptional regulator [Burkholderia cepacia]KML62557.1 hypothetical protein VL15_03130 [Burkholderia cepacia]
MTNRNGHPQSINSVLLDPSFDYAAAITGMTQPKMSQVRRCKLQNISLERLMEALVSLDQHAEIVVRSARRSHAARITVAK